MFNRVVRSRRAARQADPCGRRSLSRAVFYAAERLEGRVLLSTFTVTTAADSAPGMPDIPGSLRYAIDQSNASSGPNLIQFDITAGPLKIQPQSPLPPITTEVTIDGYSQPNAMVNPVTSTIADNAKILIQIDGSSVPSQYTEPIGLEVTAANCKIRGLSVTEFYDGIEDPGNDNTIAGCFLGVNPQGVAAGNRQNGIAVTGSGNTIGGTAASDENVVSGNIEGIVIAGTGAAQNRVEGNLIGTDLSGRNALPNRMFGVDVAGGAAGNFIGDSAGQSSNVISGNGDPGFASSTGLEIGGIDIENPGTSNNQVIANYIGTARDGQSPVPNYSYAVEITRGATSNVIGGFPAGASGQLPSPYANVISATHSFSKNGGFEAGYGVLIAGNTSLITADNQIAGNFIGTDIGGKTALPNDYGIAIINAPDNTIGGTAAADRNVISGNSLDGILLGGAAPGANGNAIEGNYVGLDSSGDNPLPNQIGLVVDDRSSGNTVGGANPLAGNIISGNSSFGAEFGGANTLVGNYIGTNAGGDAAVGNGSVGVVVGGGEEVGGVVVAMNLISGNSNTGLQISSAASATIVGNKIGTNASGTGPVPNQKNGVELQSPNVTLGGAAAGDLNIISANLSNGVVVTGTNEVIEGNYVGIDKSGGNSLGNGGAGIDVFNAPSNRIGIAGVGNTISGNKQYGIRIEGSSPGTVIQSNYVGLDPTGGRPLPNLSDGIRVESSQVTIGGDHAKAEGNVVSGNAGNGIIYIKDDNGDASGGVISGNYIGTNVAGDQAVANGIAAGGDGVVVESTNTTIGGTTAGARNVISGNNRTQLLVSGAGDVIQNDYLGTASGGNLALTTNDPAARPDDGLIVAGTSENVTGNVISGNQGDGVQISRASGCTIGGNMIGVGANGTPVPNSGTGIQLDSGAHDDTIGGAAGRNFIQNNGGSGISPVGGSAAAGDRNVVRGNIIAHNGGYGIDIEGGSSDTIGGTAADDGNVIEFNGDPNSRHNGGVVIFAGTGHTVEQNLIRGNFGLGIDLGGDGVPTPNDSQPHTGPPNHYQDFPVLTSAVTSSDGTMTTVEGSLTGIAGRQYRIEFFADSTPDASGYGQGEKFIDAIVVAIPNSGIFSFRGLNGHKLLSPIPSGEVITATATDLQTGDTSEFARDIAVGTVYWTGAGDGTNWDDPNNWTGHTVPGPADHAVIDVLRPPNTPIQVSGAQAVTTLISSASLSIGSGGSLKVTDPDPTDPSPARLTDVLTVGTDGTLIGGPYVFSGSGQLVGNGGTLSGITVNGNISVAQSQISVSGNLLLNGTVVLGSFANNSTGAVFFTGPSQTFGAPPGGQAVVLFAGTGRSELFNQTAGSTLTVDGHVLIHGSNGELLNTDDQSTILEAGTISADTPGGTISAGGKPIANALGTFTITGSVSAANGATLNLGGHWSSSGRVAIDGGTLNLYGQFPAGKIGTFFPARVGGSVNVYGTMTNAAGPLQLDASTGDFQLTGGRLDGVTVTCSDGAKLVLTPQGGTLNHVTLRCDVAATTSHAYAMVTGGLLLDGTATLGGPGTSDTGLRFEETQTFDSDSVGTVNFAGGSPYLRADQAGITLTLGHNLTVTGGAAGGGTLDFGTGAADAQVVNIGTIRAGTPVGDAAQITVTVPNFTNQGVVTAVPGGVVNLLPTPSTNPNISSGNLTFQSNGTAVVGGTVVATAISVAGAATTLALTGQQAQTGTLTQSGGIVMIGGTASTRPGRAAAATTLLTVLTRYTISGGLLDLGPHGQATIGAVGEDGLTIVAAGSPAIRVEADDQSPGVLRLAGNVVVMGPGSANIKPGGSGLRQGTVVLLGSSNSSAVGFNVSAGAALAISASITQEVQPASLLKEGDGLLELSGANTYSGGTSVTGGVLQADSPAALGSGSVSSLPPGTLSFGGGAKSVVLQAPLAAAAGDSLSLDLSGGVSLTVPGLTLGKALFVSGDAGSSLTVTGPVTLLADATINNSVPVLFQQRVGGSGGIEKTGTGTLTLSGTQDNNYTGQTTVDGGTVELSKSSGIAIPHALRINGGGTVRFAAPQQIAPASQVTLNSVGGTAELDLNGNEQTIAGLTFTPTSAGLVLLHGGTLVDSGDSISTVQDDVKRMWIRDAVDSSSPPPVATGPAGVIVGTAPARLPADFNHSGKVDFSDLLILAQNYGKSGTDNAHGDANGDGKVDFSDLLILAQSYGQTAATPAELLRRLAIRPRK